MVALKPKAAAGAAKPGAKPAQTQKQTAQPTKRKFVYEPDTAEAVAEQATASSGSFDSYFISGILNYRVREGENEIRIIKLAGAHWGYEIWLHYGIGPDNTPYLCPRKMRNEPCCLCDERTSSSSEEEVKALRPSKRYVAWLIDRKDEKTGPKVWAMPPDKIEKEIVLRQRDKKTGAVLQIADPYNGYDVSFTNTPQGDWPGYGGIDISREPSPLSDDNDLLEKWLEYVQERPLASILKFYEQNYIKRIRGGFVEKKDELDADETQQADEPAADEGEQGEVGAEVPGANEIEVMDADELSALCAAHDIEIDIAEFRDIAEARGAIIEHFYPAEEAAAEEPAPKPKPAAKPAADAAKPAGGKSETAAERLRRLRNKK